MEAVVSPMLIVEFGLDSPILEETLDRNPDAIVRNEAVYQDEDGITYLFWAESDDFEGFDDALGEDPTVTDPELLTEANTRRLYRVNFTDEGEDVATFPAWSELDLVMLDAMRTHDQWAVRMRMPDREALSDYRDLCREQGFTFDLQSVYHDTGEPNPLSYGISSCQKEALVTAYRIGYFEIPRAASLATVADELDVSQQAVSERIRRGTAALVESNFPLEAGIRP